MNIENNDPKTYRKLDCPTSIDGFKEEKEFCAL
jgi:hypothetical protein